MTAAPQRILLIQHHHLGDVLLTTPSIRAARARFPAARIDFFTGAAGAAALYGNPHLDAILVKPRLWSVNRARYDAVVDMHSVPRTARVVAASRAPVRIGLRGRGPRNLAYTTLLPREQNAVYMALQKLRMLAPLGVPVAEPDLSLEIAISEADRAFAAGLFGEQGLDSSPVVAVSPVARHEFKQWGLANWAAVADQIGRQGARILITSGPGETEQARTVAAAMQTAAVWNYGATTVAQLAALYERCVLWIGNDGGPKHIATAARTPTVTVYRKQLGSVWSDPADPMQIAINSNEESPGSVTPAAVSSAALALLESRG